jgi:uncharacterized lipoprotein YmbA
MKLIAIPLLLLLAACSGTPTSSTHYLLRSDIDAESRELQPSRYYALGSLTIASYIDQPGLVLETRQREIHSARSHQWAESLRDSLRYFFAQEISFGIGEDVFFNRDKTGLTLIDISINQLHGTINGDAILIAYWVLVPPEGEAKYFQFSETRALSDDGYNALVEAEQQLLHLLATRISDSLDPGKG